MFQKLLVYQQEYKSKVQVTEFICMWLNLKRNVKSELRLGNIFIKFKWLNKILKSTKYATLW